MRNTQRRIAYMLRRMRAESIMAAPKESMAALGINLNPTHVRRTPDRLQAAWIGFQFKSRGITQDQIAKRIGVSSKTVNHVIHGIRTSGKVQKEIADTLGFSSWDSLLAARPEVAA